MKKHGTLAGLGPLCFGVALLLSGQGYKAPANRPAQAQAPTRKKAPESLFERILRLTGISATSRGLKGDTVPSPAGDIWTVDLVTSVRQRLTTQGGHRFPVFTKDDRGVLTLCGDKICLTPVDSGDTQTLVPAPTGLEKLIGVDHSSTPDDTRIVVLTAKGVGLYSIKTNEVELFSSDSSDEKEIASLRVPEPLYGDVRLFVAHPQDAMQSSSSAQGLEIYYSRGQQPARPLTSCNPDVCSEPALSHDRKQVVFVRAKK